VRPAMLAAPPSEPTPLFRVEGSDAPITAAIERLAAAWAAAVVLLAVILVPFARRSTLDPPALRLWLVFAGALAAADVTLVVTTQAIRAVVGGASLGGSLLGLVAAGGMLLAVAAGWRGRLLRRGALVIEPVAAPALPTVVRGVGYIAAGMLRVGIVLAAVVPLLHLTQPDPGGELRELASRGLGPAGTALLAFAAVILAPIGEETLFRGVLLPWLRRFLSPDAAAWASAFVFAVAHLRYGPYVLVVVVYGLALAWARMRTGRLRAPIALHVLINAAALTITLARR
jgi:membrane protease YdiL (CAAX protease family)